MPLLRYGLNDQHQLAIDGLGRLFSEDAGTYRAWIDNFDPIAEPGSIYVFDYYWSASQILTLLLSGKKADYGAAFELVLGHMMKAAVGFSLVPWVDPLVLDLDGDGLELIPLSYNDDQRFDMDGDGYAEPTGWVGSDDGFLVHDANANGEIDGISELFGDANTSGFAELAAYDTNTDGVVDATEASALRIWRDLNQNRSVDARALQTLVRPGSDPSRWRARRFPTFRIRS